MLENLKGKGYGETGENIHYRTQKSGYGLYLFCTCLCKFEEESNRPGICCKNFCVEASGYLSYVGTHVKDMEIRETPGVPNNISIKDAWAIMKESSAVTLPITKEDGQLEGLITTGDIAKSYMDAHDNYFLSNARTH